MAAKEIESHAVQRQLDHATADAQQRGIHVCAGTKFPGNKALTIRAIQSDSSAMQVRTRRIARNADRRVGNETQFCIADTACAAQDESMIAGPCVTTEVVVVLDLKDLPRCTFCSGTNSLDLNTFATNDDRVALIAPDDNVEQCGDDLRGQHQLVNDGREDQISGPGNSENDRAVLAHFVQLSIETATVPFWRRTVTVRAVGSELSVSPSAWAMAETGRNSRPPRNCDVLFGPTRARSLTMITEFSWPAAFSAVGKAERIY